VLLHEENPKLTDQLRLSQPVHDQLDDFRWLAHDEGLVDAALRSIWSNFRSQHHLEPYITQGSDAKDWLQLFAAKYSSLPRSGRPNLVGILLLTPLGRIHHQQKITTPIHLGRPPIDPLTVPPDSLLSATFVILIFTDNKNAVCGKTVGHGCSGDPQACPVLAVVHRILHLRSFHAPPNMPLCALNAIGGSSGETQLTCPCLATHFKLIRKQERNVNLWILVSVVDACCRVLASQYWPACTNKFARTKSDAQN
jgi:hypothetical protein